MSQNTVHSCVRQGNQCRIPLSFLGALVINRIRNLFCNSAFSKLPLWLSHRGAHCAPTQKAGVCSRAAARIQQGQSLEARLSMGCRARAAHTLPVSQAVHGLWGQASQTLSVSCFAAMCCSFVHHHQDKAAVLLQEGMGRCCSRATHCHGTQSSLAAGRRDKDRRLNQTPQTTCYI